ncbi:MAG: hypothetical protein U1C74_03105 [Phenylobacterium sp.]|nr:hypothetical protein [Phenylobacterium sp.]
MTSHRSPRPQAVRTLAPQPAPVGIYASKFEPGVAAEICARLAAGQSLRSICRADPAMPTEKTVWNWRRAHADFDQLYVWAVTEARTARVAGYAVEAEARRARNAAPWRAVVEGGGVLHAGGPGSAGRPAWNRGLSGYDSGIVETILDRVGLGETLVSVCRDPAMPCVATVYNWMRANPEFVAAYRHAKQVAFHVTLERAADGAPWLGNEKRSRRALERAIKAAYRRCAQIAPRTYAPGVYGADDDPVG